MLWQSRGRLGSELEHVDVQGSEEGRAHRLKVFVTSRAILRVGAQIVGMCKQIGLAQTHLKQAGRLQAREVKDCART
jgi:hypothetical protein